MSAVLSALMSLAFVFGGVAFGAVLGISLRRVLPTGSRF